MTARLSLRFTTGAYVLEHDIAAGLLGQAIGHLLADDLAQVLRDALNARVLDLNGLHRNAFVESKAAVVDRAIAHLVAPFIGDGRGGAVVLARWLLNAQCTKQVALLGGVDVQALFRSLSEKLALEPFDLLLEHLVVRLKLSQRRIRLLERARQPGVLVFECGNLRSGHSDALGQPGAKSTM